MYTFFAYYKILAIVGIAFTYHMKTPNDIDKISINRNTGIWNLVRKFFHYFRDMWVFQYMYFMVL